MVGPGSFYFLFATPTSKDGYAMDVRKTLRLMRGVLPGATYRQLVRVFRESPGAYLVPMADGFEISDSYGEYRMAWFDWRGRVYYRVNLGESLPALNQDEAWIFALGVIDLIVWPSS